MNTVEDWKDHFEIVMGFKHGETRIGTPSWSKNIYEDFREGRESFGATCTNAMEAVLIVVKQHEPSRYNSALVALKKTIDGEKEKYGKPLTKLTTMYERMSGEHLHR